MDQSSAFGEYPHGEETLFDFYPAQQQTRRALS